MALIKDGRLPDLEAQMRTKLDRSEEEQKYNLYLQAKALNEQWNLGLTEDWLWDNFIADWLSYTTAKQHYDNVVKMAEEKKAKYSVPTSDYPLTPATTEDDGSIWLWLLIPIAAIAIGKIFGTNNKRKK